jgi:hypothetical protein
MEEESSEKPEKPFGRAYLDRNLTIRPLSKLSFEQKLAQIQRSAGNMGELSPAFPKAWIGQKAKAEPLILRYLPREKETPENEIPPADPAA